MFKEIFAISTILLLMAASTASSSVTVHVCASPEHNNTNTLSCGSINAPCRSIDYAINLQRKSPPPDLIIVKACSYDNYNYTYVSKQPVHVNDSSVRLEGPMIIDLLHIHQGFFVSMGKNLTLVHVTMQHGHSMDDGGAVAVKGGSLVLENTVFRDCLARKRGGAVFGSDSQISFSKRPVFQRNTAHSAGGALYWERTTANAPYKIDICAVFDSNMAIGNTSNVIMIGVTRGGVTSGGAVTLADMVYDIHDTIFRNNSISTRGVVFLDGDTGFIGYGGALYASISLDLPSGVAATYQVRNSTFERNKILIDLICTPRSAVHTKQACQSYARGGGMLQYVTTSMWYFASKIEIEDSRFMDNEAKAIGQSSVDQTLSTLTLSINAEGGALVSLDEGTDGQTTLESKDNLFEKNSVTVMSTKTDDARGDCIGGAIHTVGGSDRLTTAVLRTIFRNNTLHLLPIGTVEPIWMLNAPSFSASGGAVSVVPNLGVMFTFEFRASYDTNTFIDCVFEWNSASPMYTAGSLYPKLKGAGLHIIASGTESVTTIQRTRFIGNRGYVFFGPRNTGANQPIRGLGGALMIEGGAVGSYDGFMKINIFDSLFVNNSLILESSEHGDSVPTGIAGGGACSFLLPYQGNILRIESSRFEGNAVSLIEGRTGRSKNTASDCKHAAIGGAISVSHFGHYLTRSAKNNKVYIKDGLFRNNAARCSINTVKFSGIQKSCEATGGAIAVVSGGEVKFETNDQAVFGANGLQISNTSFTFNQASSTCRPALPLPLEMPVLTMNAYGGGIAFVATNQREYKLNRIDVSKCTFSNNSVHISSPTFGESRGGGVFLSMANPFQEDVDVKVMNTSVNIENCTWSSNEARASASPSVTLMGDLSSNGGSMGIYMSSKFNSWNRLSIKNHTFERSQSIAQCDGICSLNAFARGSAIDIDVIGYTQGGFIDIDQCIFRESVATSVGSMVANSPNSISSSIGGSVSVHLRGKSVDDLAMTLTGSKFFNSVVKPVAGFYSHASGGAAAVSIGSFPDPLHLNSTDTAGVNTKTNKIVISDTEFVDCAAIGGQRASTGASIGGSIAISTKGGIYRNVIIIESIDIRRSSTSSLAGDGTSLGGGIAIDALHQAYFDFSLRKSNFDKSASVSDSSKGGVLFLGAHNCSESSITAKDLQFSNSQAGQGGAVYSFVSGINKIVSIASRWENIAFLHNSADIGGAAAFHSSLSGVKGTQLLKNCLVRGNVATSGGGFEVTEVSDMRLQACEFSENKAEALGGAIFSTASMIYASQKCKFESNVASKGEAVFIQSGSKFSIGDSIMSMSDSDGVSSIGQSNVVQSSSAILKCPIGSPLQISASGTRSCTQCPPSFYSIIDSVNAVCHPCPSVGAECRGGKDILALPGYTLYLLPTGPAGVVEAQLTPEGYSCPQKNMICAFGHTCAQQRNASTPYCGACNDGYSAVFGSLKCVPASSCGKPGDWGLAAAGLVLVILFVLNQFFIEPNPSFGIMKMVLYFVQVCDIVITGAGGDASVVGLFLVGILNYRFDSLGDLFPDGVCLFAQSTWSKLLLSLVVPGLFFVMLPIITLLLMINRKTRRFARAKWKTALWSLIFAAHTQIAKSVFSALDCVPVGGNVKHVLFRAGDQECYTQPYQIAAFVVGLPFVFGFPFVVIWASVKIRRHQMGTAAAELKGGKSIPENIEMRPVGVGVGEYGKNAQRESNDTAGNNDTSNRVSNTHFVTVCYRGGLFFWEAILLFERVLIAGLATFIQDPFPKAFILCLLCFAFLVLHIFIHPFQSKMAQDMWTMGQSLLVVLGFLNIGLVVRAQLGGSMEMWIGVIQSLFVLIPTLVGVGYIGLRAKRLSTASAKAVTVLKRGLKSMNLDVVPPPQDAFDDVVVIEKRTAI